MKNINYTNKHQKTLSIYFDTIEQRERLQQAAKSFKCSEEELGKQLILESLELLKNNSSLLKLKYIEKGGYLGSSNLLSEEEELTAMANDPEIQAEIAAMNAEFAATEMDGLENL